MAQLIRNVAKVGRFGPRLAGGFPWDLLTPGVIVELQGGLAVLRFRREAFQRVDRHGHVLDNLRIKYFQ